MPVSTSRYELLQKRLSRFARTLDGFAKGDVRALHGARVASRRLRELLPVLQLDSHVTAEIGRRLRKVTQRLGPSRELDVLVLQLEELQAIGASMMKNRSAGSRGRSPCWCGARRLATTSWRSCRSRTCVVSPSSLGRIAVVPWPGTGRKPEAGQPLEDGAGRSAMPGLGAPLVRALRAAVQDAGAMYLPETSCTRFDRREEASLQRRALEIRRYLAMDRDDAPFADALQAQSGAAGPPARPPGVDRTGAAGASLVDAARSRCLAPPGCPRHDAGERLSAASCAVPARLGAASGGVRPPGGTRAGRCGASCRLAGLTATSNGRSQNGGTVRALSDSSRHCRGQGRCVAGRQQEALDGGGHVAASQVGARTQASRGFLRCHPDEPARSRQADRRCRGVGLRPPGRSWSQPSRSRLVALTRPCSWISRNRRVARGLRSSVTSQASASWRPASPDPVIRSSSRRARSAGSMSRRFPHRSGHAAVVPHRRGS